MDINAQADILAQKIKHLVITTSGHTVSSATIEEFYQSFCLAFREEIMVNSTATIDTIKNRINSFAVLREALKQEAQKKVSGITKFFNWLHSLLSQPRKIESSKEETDGGTQDTARGPRP